MSQIGRIGGPLLEANLLRNGVDIAFRDTLSTTQLLYIDVNNRRIGVNLNNPSHELQVFGTTRTVNLLTDDITLPNFQISSNEINSIIGDINLDANEAIILSNLETSEFSISDNRFNTIRSNANIELRPNGTGKVEIFNNLNVRGDLHATGTITLGGTITFGDNLAQDTVNFNTDVNSNIIPDQDLTYDLGSSVKRWDYLYTNLVNGLAIDSQSVSIGGVDLALRTGNIFYVSVNGSNTNSGDHPQGPFATIRRALDAADASNGGPVTIFVFPGEYQEQLPLIVPSNVSIIGEDIRNTIVVPDTSSQSEDVFHLNGETTIQNITIKNFYYDSTNNTGYAFRFASNGIITSRSPYVQNVSVITRGSVTSINDPLGFNEGDAGKGAWIDGAELNASSFDASMLFHSCTFITPGVDAITMTNGVRVEWLNSFTYFANRGLYAADGVTGRTSQDGSTVIYGAEVRAIGSASVYGNYGAVADGPDTLMYLIQHNFGYIGSGKDSSNDKTLAIQANEAVELNSGRIYYSSTDHLGNFRIGTTFYVDFENGTTSIDTSTVTFDNLAQMRIGTDPNFTFITYNKIDTGNIRISGNTVESLSGEFNVDSAGGNINFNSDVNIAKNLAMTGNFNFDGSLNLFGNAYTDTVDFNIAINQNFNPKLNKKYNLGSLYNQWSNVWLSQADIDGIRIFDNVIQSQDSNADLELRANGLGIVLIPNKVSLSSSLFHVSGETLLNNNVSFNSLTLNGNTNITNNISLQSQFIDGFLNVSKIVNLEEIKIDDNYITTTTSNADLELRANGVGIILIPNDDVEINNNLSVNNITTSSNINITNSISFNRADISDIDISQNYITTNNGNLDLELTSTKDIIVPNDNVISNQNLTVDGITSFKNISIAGLVDQIGPRLQTGTFTQTGNLNQSGNTNFESQVKFSDIFINDNVITTTIGNNNLDLRASGLGVVLIPNNNVIVTNNLFVSSISTGNITVNQDLDLDDIIVRTSNIQINDNYITTSISNSDLELRATGNVVIPSNNAIFEQDLFVNGIANLKSTTVVGTITQTGNRNQIGNYFQTGNSIIDGQFSTLSDTRFQSLRFIDNFISIINLNENLIIEASGTGIILVNDSANFAKNLTVKNLSTGNLNINNSIALETLESSTDIQIFDNVITTTNSNSNLELRTNGVGNVQLENIFVNNSTLGTLAGNLILAPNNLLTINSTGAIRTPIGTTAQRTNILGDIRFNSTDNIFESRGSTDTISFNGIYSSDRRTSLTTHPTNNTINLLVNNVQIGSINSAGLTIHAVDIDDLFLNNNTIVTNVSNSDLELRANGTGSLVAEGFTLNTNVITPTITGTPFRLGGTGVQWVVFEGNSAVRFPSGDTASRPLTPVVGQTRHNTDTNELETWIGNQWRASAGQFDSISEAQMENEAFIQTLIYG